MIAKPMYETACRVGNLLSTRAERVYWFDRLAWLKNGAVGIEPGRGRLSYARAAELAEEQGGLQLWERG